MLMIRRLTQIGRFGGISANFKTSPITSVFRPLHTKNPENGKDLEDCTTETPVVSQMVSSIYEHVSSCQPETFTEEQKMSKVLEPRTIPHSYRKFIIPLSTSKEKKKEYLNASGSVRIGKILEYLDHMAVHVAYVHNSDEGRLLNGAQMTLPRTIVTASVKRIDFHKKEINSSRDIIMDGQVTYAGVSSMQVSIRLFQNDEHDNLTHLLNADFIMVSRDPLDGSHKIRVHGLVARTPDEAETINQTKEHLKRMSREGNRQSSDEELRLIDEMYQGMMARNGSTDLPVLKPSEMWLHLTKLSVTEICFPEYQNMYGKIFGGFLMRKALELAFTNAKLYCKGRVSIRAMDRIEFVKAVEIGNVLHFDSFVTYTQGKFLQVKVVASVSDQNVLPELAKMNNATLGQEARVNTNVFNFTMESIENPDVLTVVPKHYAHAKTFLEGRRLLNNTLKRIID